MKKRETGVSLAAAIKLLEEADESLRFPNTEANRGLWEQPYRKAIELLDGIIAADPKNDVARVYLAEAHYAVGESGRGGMAYRIAEELLSRDVTPDVRAGAYCIFAYAAAHEAEGAPDAQTREWYRLANAADPGHAKAAVMYADYLWGHEGDAEGALAVLDAALLIQPEAPSIHEYAAFVCQRAYLSHKDVEQARKAIHHALKLESIKPLRFTECGELARCYARLSDWRSMMTWLKAADEREKSAVEEGKWGFVRRGIDDPVMWKLTEGAIKQCEATPEDLEHAAYLAVCLEYMQPVLASLCCDDIADVIDAKVSGAFQYLTERATLRLNTALMSEGAFQYVPLENPWRHSVAPGPLGRRVRIISLDETGLDSTSNGGH
jgi:tetratricopeptide (TPR) repeat protein